MLQKLQEDFQAYVLGNSTAVVKKIVSTKKLTAKKRLQIYQHSYMERIIQAIQQDFPRLCAAIGEPAFVSLVEDYIAHYPSHDYNLRYIGKNVAAFIMSRDADFKPYADLARQEWMELDLGTESNERTG